MPALRTAPESHGSSAQTDGLASRELAESPGRSAAHVRHREQLDAAIAELAELPPLVTSWEIEKLKEQLARAARRGVPAPGRRLRRELRRLPRPTPSPHKLKILLQMRLVLLVRREEAGDPHRAHRRPVREAALERRRDAGRRDAAELPRRPRQPLPLHAPRTASPIPTLMLRGYERAALTLNFIRSLIDGGFADLHHPEYWDLGFVARAPPLAPSTSASCTSVSRLARLRRADHRRADARRRHRVDFFTSHEASPALRAGADARACRAGPAGTTSPRTIPWIGMRTARARRRARRVLPRHREPDRRSRSARP